MLVQVPGGLAYQGQAPFAVLGYLDLRAQMTEAGARSEVVPDFSGTWGPKKVRVEVSGGGRRVLREAWDELEALRRAWEGWKTSAVTP